jgi:hypothetical protein
LTSTTVFGEYNPLYSHGVPLQYRLSPYAAPVAFTVSVFEAEVSFFVNATFNVFEESIEITHAPVPVHAPEYPESEYPTAGEATTVTLSEDRYVP